MWPWITSEEGVALTALHASVVLGKLNPYCMLLPLCCLARSHIDTYLLCLTLLSAVSLVCCSQHAALTVDDHRTED